MVELRGRDLRHERVQAQVSQNDLADALRIGRPTLVDVERERVAATSGWIYSAIEVVHQLACAGD